MKIVEAGTTVTISEGRFLPRFVRYFAVLSIVCGIALIVCGIGLIIKSDYSTFQTIIGFFLSIAAISYGVYLLYLFPDIRVTLDKKTAKTEIVTRRLMDKSVRELETRRITGLVVEKGDGAAGNDIFRIVFRTYKGEVIPLSGSWTDKKELIEEDAKKIHAFLDSACSLDLPKVIPPPARVELPTVNEVAATKRATVRTSTPPPKS